jgi:hypothetical protein
LGYRLDALFDFCCKRSLFEFTDGTHSGMVVNVANGVAVQKVDRSGTTVCHDVGKLSATVRAGDVVDIKYANGTGIVTSIKSVELER